jgi:hypothetical protein
LGERLGDGLDISLCDVPWGLEKLVDCVDYSVLDDGVASKNAGAIDKDVTALDSHRHGSAGKCPVSSTISEVRGEDGRSEKGVLTEDVGQGTIRQPGRNDPVVRGQKGDAWDLVQLPDESCALQGSKNLVGSEEGEGEGQEPGKGKHARHGTDDAPVEGDVEARDLDGIAQAAVDDRKGSFGHVLLNDAGIVVGWQVDPVRVIEEGHEVDCSRT